MNEWKDERMNEWMNERINEWMNESISQSVNQSINQPNLFNKSFDGRYSAASSNYFHTVYIFFIQITGL